MTHQSETLICTADGCDASVKDHAWGRINAQRNGWFFQLDGRAWCPEHQPEWLAAWRRRKAEREGNSAEGEGR